MSRAVIVFPGTPWASQYASPVGEGAGDEEMTKVLPASVAAILAITIVAVAGCTPYPVHLTDSQRQEECGGIAAEYARQYDIAQRSGIMASFLVEGAVRLNTINVIAGLQTQAAIARCPWAIPLSRAPSGGQQPRQTAPASYATLGAPHRNGDRSLCATGLRSRLFGDRDWLRPFT
jgi:hypothetical protein